MHNPTALFVATAEGSRWGLVIGNMLCLDLANWLGGGGQSFFNQRDDLRANHLDSLQGSGVGKRGDAHLERQPVDTA